MSALNDDLGGKLNVLVDVPRAMSPTEIREFLTTGVFPDLSKPPPEEGGVKVETSLNDTETRLWLSSLTAAGISGTARFDPQQLRDHNGRWTVELGESEVAQLMSQRQPLVNSADVLNAAPVGIIDHDLQNSSIVCHPPMFICDDSSSRTRTNALLAYRTYDYDIMNSMLRGTYDEAQQRQDFSPADDAEWEEHKRTISTYISVIDEITATSKLTDDVVVLRGTATGRGIFGDALDDDLTGWSWQEKSYVSTTADPKVANSFGSAGLIMTITVPKGTGAVKLSSGSGDPSKTTSAESELMLQRGLTLRVMRDNGRSADGTRRLDVEVVPA